MKHDWRSSLTLPGYEVNSDGELRNAARPTRILKTPLTEGYPSIRARGKSCKVHTLVCEVFHGPKPTPGHEVRHLNGDRTDNRAENLAWGTRSENVRDAIDHGTHSQLRKTHCPQGHEYTPENTYVGPSSRGGRRCIQCKKVQVRLHRLNRKESA
jgi:hypothetical protein